jgi:hypothetical protein
MRMVRSSARPVTLGMILVLVIGAALAGCTLFNAPASTVCDGISSELGGCDADRPSFAGTTCEAVAQEFGDQLDSRLLAIHRGPDSGGESKSVRATDYAIVAASLANLHLRRIGLIRECSAPDFVRVAETRFSEDFRSVAGALLHDGDVPASYAEWRDWLMALMTIIDSEEDVTLPPS